MKKRIILIAIIGLLLVMLPLIAGAEIVDSGTCGENATWTLSDTGLLTISGSGAMYDLESSQSAPWELKKAFIQGVEIEGNISRIGSYSFKNCNNLQSINIFNGPTHIGRAAFAYCSALTTVSIPDSVTTIESYAFDNCTKLPSIILPNSVTTLGEGAFTWCTNLETVELSKNLTVIPSGLFFVNYKLEDITIPENVTIIERQAFYGNSKLSSIHIPSTILSISDNAFENCRSLTDVYYDGNINDTENIQIESNNINLTGATWHCTDGNTIGIGPTNGTCGENATWTLSDTGVLTISGSGAMYDLDSSQSAPWELKKGFIQEVEIGGNITRIGGYSFEHCNNLHTVLINQGPTHIGEGAFYYCSALTTINIPDSVTAIESYAFSNCRELTSIILPNSVTSLGDAVFTWCTALKTVTLSANLTTIPSGTFFISDVSPEIIIPEGVTIIDRQAFYSNHNLSSIHLPSTIQSISSNAFENCEKLTDVYFNGKVKDTENISIDSNNAYLTGATWHCTDGNTIGIGPTNGTCGENATWTLSDTGVLTISGSGAMYDLDSSQSAPWELKKGFIQEVEIGGNITRIGSNSFRNCNNLQTATLIEGTVVIGESAFANCGALRTVIIPDSVVTIERCAFYDCIQLPSVIIPDSVTTLGEEVFEHCYQLQTITLSANLTTIPSGTFFLANNLQNVVIPEGITTIGRSAFYNNSSLSHIHLPSTIQSIDHDAFEYCKKLTDVYYGGKAIDTGKISIDSNNFYLTSATWHCIDGNTVGIFTLDGLSILQLPSNLLSIKEDAFANLACQAVIIPDGCTEIGENAFKDCYYLKYIRIPSTVKNCPASAFEGCNDNLVIDWEGH